MGPKQRLGKHAQGRAEPLGTPQPPCEKPIRRDPVLGGEVGWTGQGGRGPVWEAAAGPLIKCLNAEPERLGCSHQPG